MSTAANLLPIPGAFLVRVQGCGRWARATAEALASTAVVGLVWIGVSALMAAILLAVGQRWAAAAVAGAGIPPLIGAHAWLRRAVPEPESGAGSQASWSPSSSSPSSRTRAASS